MNELVKQVEEALEWEDDPIPFEHVRQLVDEVKRLKEIALMFNRMHTEESLKVSDLQQEVERLRAIVHGVLNG